MELAPEIKASLINAATLMTVEMVRESDRRMPSSEKPTQLFNVIDLFKETYKKLCEQMELLP